MATPTKKERERRRRATSIGAVLAMVAVLLLVGIVGALKTNLAGSVVAGELKTQDVLWSSESASDIHTGNPPLVRQLFCTSATETLTFDFASSAVNGQGQGMTAIHSDVINGCNVANSAVLQVVYELTAAEITALNPKAIGVGFSEDMTAFEEVNLSIGLQFDGTPTGNLQQVPMTLAVFTQINETRQWFFEFKVLDFAILGFLPTARLVIWLSSSGDHFPVAGTTWNIDTTLYGENTSMNISVDFADMFGTSNILTFTFYGVGLLGLLAAIAIWPTTSTDSISAMARRRAGRG